MVDDSGALTRAKRTMQQFVDPRMLKRYQNGDLHHILRKPCADRNWVGNKHTCVQDGTKLTGMPPKRYMPLMRPEHAGTAVQDVGPHTDEPHADNEQ